MDTQCKSCGSVKFEYKEGKKVCAYCGRETYNDSFSKVSYENTLAQIKAFEHLYTLVDSYRTLTLKSTIF